MHWCGDALIAVYPHQGAVDLAWIRGELGRSNVAAGWQRIGKDVSTDRKLIVDLTEASFYSAAAVRELLNFGLYVASAARWIVVCNPLLDRMLAAVDPIGTVIPRLGSLTEALRWCSHLGVEAPTGKGDAVRRWSVCVHAETTAELTSNTAVREQVQQLVGRPVRITVKAATRC